MIVAVQVVLAQSKKDSNEYVALKVVFLQSPEMQEDPEHVAIMRRWVMSCHWQQHQSCRIMQGHCL